MNYLYALLTYFVLSCSSNDSTSIPDPVIDLDTTTKTTVTYVVDDSDFANPDRGFYKYSETRASNYQVLDEEELRGYRASVSAQGANYETINTLVFRYFILDSFTNGAISQAFLDNMQLDFDAARNAGVKIIPRFTYTVNSNSGSCNEGFICPPYGDAPKDVVLAQIQQVGTVLTTNADVITAVQMGFIGTWGENYYTDFFGDPSPNANQGKLLDENWQDRIDVLKALLEATPKELMVQVRYPQMKQRYVYGINATTNVAAITEAEAFSEADKARIGFHNDCLFASADDFGTYEDYGNSSSERVMDVSNLKPYFQEDSTFVIVGGETCTDEYNPESNCSPDGIADIDLRSLHYTYLNTDFNNDVNNDWASGGCIETIKKNLGYRFVLKTAIFPDSLTTADNLEVAIVLENVGYASPAKERNVTLVLRNKVNGEITPLEFDTDIRLWFSEITLKQTFSLPESLTPGEYEIFLHLEEAYETIKGRSEYAIRMANQNVWEESTGYNNLKHTLLVD
ncbi:MAG: DUF4832 domain-containing protein [Flavobacteriaceae bacterium]